MTARSSVKFHKSKALKLVLEGQKGVYQLIPAYRTARPYNQHRAYDTAYYSIKVFRRLR